MRTILHILTKPEDPLARALVDAQRRQPDLRVEVADLTPTEPNYATLLEQIFAADSVQVW